MARHQGSFRVGDLVWMMRRIAAVALALLIVLPACTGSDRGAIVAAGTTLVDSGFMDGILNEYRDATGTTLSVVALSSSEALAYLESGTAQVAITHNQRLITDYGLTNPGSSTIDVFTSDFIVVGPPLSAGVSTVEEVFVTVAEAAMAFVSRDDGSGTHEREREIWASIDIDPDGAPWYIRTGTGMGSSLQVADQRDAYILSELGAYLRAAGSLRHEPVALSDTSGLENPYFATLPASESNVGGEGEGRQFIEWLTSEAGRAAIDRVNRDLFGVAVYRSP